MTAATLASTHPVAKLASGAATTTANSFSVSAGGTVLTVPGGGAALAVLSAGPTISPGAVICNGSSSADNHNIKSVEGTLSCDATAEGLLECPAVTPTIVSILVPGTAFPAPGSGVGKETP